MQKVLVLLPKLGSYRFKTPELKASYEEIINNEINKLLNKGHKIYCVQEDMLALTLFFNVDCVNWITLYEERDKSFMKINVEDYPKDLYERCEAELCRKDVQDIMSNKCKLQTIRDCKGDMQKYTYSRYEYLQKKLRVGSSALARKHSCVLQFTDGNNYHDIVKPEVGDGKIVVTVDLLSTVKTIHYGGCPIEQDMYEQLLEVV
ncbi:MAG: hypothetical protein IJE43_19305 [Alphaproteobacteria bacterium]|nr:hypothetical protein [Alphaproteobacteria bacterium]